MATGTNGADTLRGTTGADTLLGLLGADSLSGDAGNDTIWGDDIAGLDALGGNDTIDGGTGNDSVVAGAGNDSVIGGLGLDTLLGNAGDDTIYGDDVAGADTLGSADLIDGGSGNDRIVAGAGADTITGGSGSDNIQGNAGNDAIYGDDTAGNSALGAADTLDGGDGDDLILGGRGGDSILGGEGNDRVYGDDNNGLDIAGGDDFIDVGNGNDYVTGGYGNDRVIGGRGADELYGHIGNDTIYGDDTAGTDSLGGNDTIYGGVGDDSMVGGFGADSMIGEEGVDTILGGDGNDTILGDGGLATAITGAGDSIDGGNGNDSIFGQAGVDTIFGGAGNDTLDGGAAADQLTGGAGFDRFVASEGTARDTITDFEIGGSGNANLTDNDIVDLSAYYNATSLAAWNAVLGNPKYATAIDWLRADQADGLLTQGYRTVAGVPTNVNLSIRTSNGTALEGKYLKFDNTNVVCFTPGVMIEAEFGAIDVAMLKVGDRVVTRDRGLQAVRWIGSRRISAAELALDPALRPIRISAGALGNGLPEADLVVSPMHRMVVTSALIEAETGRAEALIAARNLVDLDGVAVADDVAEVVYIHFMCDQHEVVIANGAATETLNVGVNTADHLTAEAYAEITALFPELASTVVVPVRTPIRGQWGRDVARRHAEAGLALAG